MLDFENRVLTLEKPIKFGSENISELVLKEPTGQEVALLKKSMEPVDYMNIGFLLAGQPSRMINLMTKKDAYELLELVSFLFAA